MRDQNERIKNRELEAPRRVVDALRSAYGARVEVPPRVDEAVLAAARRQLARGRRVALARKWAMGGALATAVVLVVAFALIGPGLLPHRERVRLPAAPMVAREDVDRNGRVDILDAFALARRVESAGEFDVGWDMNDDGLVDSEDVDRVAMAAVKLDRRTLQ